MIDILIIAVIIFLYLIIGALADGLLGLDSVGFIFFWPFMLPCLVAIHIGYSIAEWIEKKRWQRWFGGKKDEEN